MVVLIISRPPDSRFSRLDGEPDRSSGADTIKAALRDDEASVTSSSRDDADTDARVATRAS
jgi:hypothetical protein